ncbi:class I SAM-dependent DNA methyltransferase [Virgibacillus flavescens]|uniref:class I SAM-dependent DNA methyltransferase n=1 Tax=Virgibacillus flavescens TaxID=1611422 RepID=UPI003D346A55
MAYQEMARFYDKLMDTAPYTQWAEMTEEILKNSSIPVKSIVDLGCGTGQLTTRLANSGYQMIGIDFSSEMLSYAQQRASEKKQTIQWINQDIRETEGIAEMDAVISYCDVMNYITSEEELNLVFANVESMLKNNGLFIFDVHSLYHVENNLVNQTFATVEDDMSSIWFCSEGESKGEMYHDLTFFISGEQETYKRYDEYHHQKTFSIEFYKKLLEQNGLQIRNIYGDFSMNEENLDEKAERIFFITEKRSAK